MCGPSAMLCTSATSIQIQLEKRLQEIESVAFLNTGNQPLQVIGLQLRKTLPKF